MWHPSPVSTRRAIGRHGGGSPAVAVRGDCCQLPASCATHPAVVCICADVLMRCRPAALLCEHKSPRPLASTAEQLVPGRPAILGIELGPTRVSPDRDTPVGAVLVGPIFEWLESVAELKQLRR